MKISNRAGQIPPSMTLEISAKAKALKAEGKSIIAFTAGEPDFNTPDFIVKSANHALDIGFTKYTPSSGTPELKKAICEKFKKDNNLIYEPKNIIVSTGAKSSLYHALFAIVDEGEEVIIPTPYWLTYDEQVKLCGGKSVFVNTKKENGYKITPEELENAITEKTSCLILNSPSNPSGVVYSEEELKALAEVLVKYGIYVVSDEIYEKLVYDGVKHYSIACVSEEMKKLTIVINGVSKAYAMTGWRIGYLACDEQIAKVINNVQSHTTSNATSISQYASVTALNEGDEFICQMNKTFEDRKNFIVEKLKGINRNFIEPQGAFYVFVDVADLIGKKYEGVELTGSLEIAKQLLNAGVAVIPGLPFGNDNFIRLSYAVSKDDIALGIERIGKFISQLIWLLFFKIFLKNYWKMNSFNIKYSYNN